MIASAAAAVQLKLAADNAGRTALWYFIMGNVIGFFGPLSLTFGLKYANPNIMYALCYGGALALTQIALWRMFKQPLSVWQWSGIITIGIGVILLQIRKG